MTGRAFDTRLSIDTRVIRYPGYGLPIIGDVKSPRNLDFSSFFSCLICGIVPLMEDTIVQSGDSNLKAADADDGAATVPVSMR